MATSESMVAWLIQNDPNVRNRILAIVRNAWWNDATVVDPRAPVPLDDIAWAVATTKAVRDSVTAAYTEKPQASAAMDAITDGQLVTAINKALARIKAAEDAAKAAQEQPSEPAP